MLQEKDTYSPHSYTHQQGAKLQSGELFPNSVSLSFYLFFGGILKDIEDKFSSKNQQDWNFTRIILSLNKRDKPKFLHFQIKYIYI